MTGTVFNDFPLIGKYFPRFHSNGKFRLSPPLSDYTINSNRKSHRKPTGWFSELQFWGPEFKSCDVQSFFFPKNRGFNSFLVENKYQKRFPRPQTTHFCSRSQNLSRIVKPFSKRPIFRTPCTLFPTPLYLRPRQKKLLENFKWGPERVNRQINLVFID